MAENESAGFATEEQVQVVENLDETADTEEAREGEEEEKEEKKVEIPKSEITEDDFAEFNDSDYEMKDENKTEKHPSQTHEELTPANDDEEEVEEELTEEQLEALFNKNTSSFRCLAQILLSRSSLLRHPLYNFPPLTDPGIDAAFSYVEPQEMVDDVYAEKYKKLCKEMNIVPISRVVRSLPTKDLNLRYYGLTTQQIKAIARALTLNTHVENLDLEENFLSPEATTYIEEMLRDNNTLKVLNMKECQIGPEGAANISEGIMVTQSLRELDLSRNALGNEGLANLATSFKENVSLKRLDLSHNGFDEDVSPLITNILKENTVLEDLNLSWNNFGTLLAMKNIFKEGMPLNKSLRSLGLAWNGITDKLAIRCMAKYIRETESLELLDLGNNRIDSTTFGLINSAIYKNKSLRGLSLACNPLSPDNALTLGKSMVKGNIEVLDLENVFVHKDFVPILKKAVELDKVINVQGILGNWTIKGPNVSRLLFDRARRLAQAVKKKKNRKDFSHFVLALPEKPMRRGDFETEFQKFKAKKIDADLFNEIVKTFPYKKDGVDCISMKNRYEKLYPDAEPAPPPGEKKKRKCKGKGKDKGKKDKKVAEKEVQSAPQVLKKRVTVESPPKVEGQSEDQKGEKVGENPEKVEDEREKVEGEGNKVEGEGEKVEGDEQEKLDGEKQVEADEGNEEEKVDQEQDKVIIMDEEIGEDEDQHFSETKPRSQVKVRISHLETLNNEIIDNEEYRNEIAEEIEIENVTMETEEKDDMRGLSQPEIF